MRRPRRGVATSLAVALAALPAGAAAQAASGGVRGTVVDEGSGTAVAGALVALDAGLTTLTDEDGVFLIADVVAGPYRIAAVTRGCRVSLGDVEVPPGRDVIVQLRVRIPEEDEGPWSHDERARGAAVRVVTAEDMQRRSIRTLVDAVRLVAPEMVGWESSQAGSRAGVRSRGVRTLAGSPEPLVVVDGLRVAGRAADILAMIDAAEVQRIEVARSAAGGWAQGTAGSNGVIRVFTRDARSGIDPDTPPERCNFEFPR